MEFENPRVLITDAKIETIKEIIPVLEQVTRLNQPLLIIAEDVTGDIYVFLRSWILLPCTGLSCCLPARLLSTSTSRCSSLFRTLQVGQQTFCTTLSFSGAFTRTAALGYSAVQRASNLPAAISGL